MTHLPDHWIKTDMSAFDLKIEGKLGDAPGWTFWEHPTEGDEHTVLAVSMDFFHDDPADKGPIVWDTGDFDIPEFI